MRALTATALCIALAAASPALARENCDRNGVKPGLTIEFGFSFGGKAGGDSFDPDIAKIELRKRGVMARSVSMASDGCVEAFVQRPDGSWNSEYYDPDTWEKVSD
jgi:hypothetical protein